MESNAPERYGKRLSIGLLTLGATADYHAVLMEGLREAAEERDVDFIVFDYKTMSGRNTMDGLFPAALAWIKRFPLDGLMYLGWLKPLAEGPGPLLEALPGLPLYSMGTVVEGLPSSYVDNAICARDVARHLVHAHGKRRPVLVAPHERDRRTAEWEEALKEDGLYDPALVIGEDERAGPDAAAFAREIFRRYVEDRSLGADAFYFMYSIELALFMDLLARGGYSVPDDFALVCNEDGDMARSATPAVTAVDYPWRRLGRKSLDAFSGFLRGEKGRSPIAVPTGVTYRRSCGCLPLGLRHLPSVGLRPDVESRGSARAAKAIGLGEERELGPGEAAAWISRLARAGGEALVRGIEALVERADAESDVRYLDRELELAEAAVPGAGQAFLEAKLLLRDRLARGIAAQSIRSAAYSRRIEEAGQALTTSFDLEGIASICVDRFPDLGIPYAAFIAGGKAFRIKRPWADSMPFPAEGAVDPAALLGARGRIFADVQFLARGEETLGIIVFGAVPEGFRGYHDLAILLSAAVEGARLMRDLSRKNMRLLDLDRAKTTFFENVSHEIRTPLSLILGPLARIMEGETEEPAPRTASALSTMKDNANRLLRLVNQILDLSKMEAGMLEADIRSVDVPSLLRLYVSIVSSACAARGISIEFKDPGPLAALADRELFENAVFNLLSNALKYTQDGGSIVVSARREGGFVKATIKDSGPGVSAEDAPRIFDRFIQGKAAPRKSGKGMTRWGGTGIGLAYARETARIQGGDIVLESKPGEGAAFSILLPAAAEIRGAAEDAMEPVKEWNLAGDEFSVPSRDGRAPEPRAGEGSGPILHPRVLVIEDSPQMRAFICEVLSTQYGVAQAGSAEEALERIGQEPPDIILTDMLMPGEDGLSLVRRLRAGSETADIPVIVLTAQAGGHTRAMGLEAGADDFLAKPFSGRELRARVATLLERKRKADVLASSNQSLKGIVNSQTRIIEMERDSAIRMKELAERQLEGFMLVLAQTIESKDPYTGGHVERVGRYARDLARAAGMDADAQRGVYLGGIVHDLGKIGIRDAVLNSAEKADSGASLLLRAHTRIGSELLKSIENIAPIARIVRSHHEHWDGSGYPDGLSGDAIPLEARIVCISDYWDAITTDRPYRAAMPLERALGVMSSESARAFDPGLLGLFLDEAEGIYARYLPAKSPI
jgi:response regulator RpfG family c-di-GMP phosphodiesterase/signal transduction histidine kinase/DNA-binding LacI/PurR family transcriptional regulator